MLREGEELCQILDFWHGDYKMIHFWQFRPLTVALCIAATGQANSLPLQTPAPLLPSG